MTDWRTQLNEKKVLIVDGAWGTELMNRGMNPREVPDAWNIDRPEEIYSVALSYVNAGADIILTNTFGGSPLKLAKRRACGKRRLTLTGLGQKSRKRRPLVALWCSDRLGQQESC